MRNYFESQGGVHPVWCPDVTEYVRSALSGLYRPDRIMPGFTQLMAELMQSEQLSTYADLERHAREDYLPLRLAATPFDATRFSYSAECIDVRTMQPKPYWLNALIGKPVDYNSTVVLALNEDVKVNIPRLATETGMLAVRLS